MNLCPFSPYRPLYDHDGRLNLILAGRCCSAVALRRKKFGIPPALFRLWTPAEIRLLGTMSDAQLARRINRSPGVVKWQRLRHHLPAFKKVDLA